MALSVKDFTRYFK